MKKNFSLVLSALAAYSFSYAIDILLGGLFGIYMKNTIGPPVITWSIISIIAFIGAVKIGSLHRRLSVPFVIFGGLALLGAIVGTHAYNYGVAGIMFFQASIIWVTSRQSSSNGVVTK